jgi:2-acylglycerol O-acyltransferase 2
MDPIKTAKKRAVEALAKRSDGPFPDNALAGKAEMSLVEELTVIFGLLFIMGGPLFWILLVGTYTVCFGSWMQLFGYVGLTLLLANHPLPSVAEKAWNSAIVRASYKYFSYRFVWCDDDLELTRTKGPWIGAGVPHGVMPFSNLLSIPAINSFAYTGGFVGAPASVVFKTPFLRYFTMLGCCGVGGKEITNEITEKKNCVGIVPDGIAGIFKCSHDEEVVYLKNRKGLAKLAIRTGTPIVPAFSVGNSMAFSCWFDQWGIMEKLSRRYQASIFMYWGRYLPSSPITLPALAACP